MDARLTRIVLVLTAFSSLGATYRTPNFIVDAPTPKIAQQVAAKAEQCRVELAREWLGKTLPRWYKPCHVRVTVGQIGAGGATTFAFDRGHVFGWQMNIQGTLERILDSVLPHEVCHTIFACHFRRPLPRWADEGAATLAEDESERRRQKVLFEKALKDRRKIPLRTLLSIKEYPRDMNHVLTLYAEGYSLANHLVQRGGKARYLKFVDFANTAGWDRAVAKYYGLPNVDTLDKQWCAWVVAGCPRLDLPPGQQLADAGSTRNKGLPPDSVVRSQNPDTPADSRVRGLAGRAKPRDMSVTAPVPRPRDVSQQTLSAHTDGRRFASRVGTAVERADGLRQANPQDARQRANADGWIPQEDTVVPNEHRRQATRRGRIVGPSESVLANRTQDSHATRKPSSRVLQGEQNSRSGRITNESDFPQCRIGRGSTRLGNVSESSFSP